MDIKFKKQAKTFTDERGNKIDYYARFIIIEGIPYSVNRADGKVFDYQFKEYLESK